MKYFTGDQSALETDEEAQPLPLKVPDPGVDELPFGYLDDRRFEVLAYRLKTFELRSTENRVTLMKGVGERGRDVVVYGADGRVREIIQCKNLGKRFTAPDLRKELLKLAHTASVTRRFSTTHPSPMNFGAQKILRNPPRHSLIRGHGAGPMPRSPKVRTR